MNSKNNNSGLKEALLNLRQEHQELDKSIATIQKSDNSDTLKIQRMKKRKLMIKDQIANLEDRLLPDIIA